MSKTTIFWSVIALLIIGGLGTTWYMNTLPSKYTELAQCINDKGAKFYGAFWCPHCQAQKKVFGNAAEKLPYIECSEPNGKDQKQECKDVGIVQYPTWKFADGSEMRGEQSAATLAEKTGCTLPE